MSYIVRGEENSHYGDEEARWTVGECEDHEVAVQMAMRVVDEELKELYVPGMSASDLFQQHLHFGHDAYIIGEDPQHRFSGHEYARKRCAEICRGGTRPSADI